ncbi:malate-sodium symport [Aster yellows witches'-broom phytoplasma AYWB]|uniref:Malate-sodium symport n=2 Tax=16SrI (Aster yellows group) TaxID=3042590 RepID=Q2NK74_AYWBP|nr:2-hydroxycarboxylate transporter family protein [Aster yellows witches'-broom phytoplasma]ABC65169.1 malate-sodium symport [Aster yellows witches'-broom phytoplasma AYWB]
MSIENEQSSPDNKENNNNNKDSKNVNSVFVPKKTILGFSVPLFFLMILVVFVQVFVLGFVSFKTTNKFEPVFHPLITPLLIAMLLAAVLQKIGAKTPLLKDIGGGSILCILVPSILFTYPFFKDGSIFLQMQNFMRIIMKHLNAESITVKIQETKYTYKAVGFSNFFVSALIIGSFLSMDKKLLKSSFKKFIPLILVSLITGALFVGTLGALLHPIGGLENASQTSKGAFLDAVFYIFAPLASGGMSSGVTPLKNAYAGQNLDLQEPFMSHMTPALLVGGIFSIFASGLIKKFVKTTKYSGYGKLEVKDVPKNPNKNTYKLVPEKLSYHQITTGLIAIFTLYLFSVLIKESLILLLPNIKKYLPEYIVFLVFVVVLMKLFNVVSDYYNSCINQASKFVTTNFTSAFLVILGSSIPMEAMLKQLNFKFVFTCIMCVLLVALVAGYLGKKLGYYPVESSITAGLCTNSIGGAGNVAILSASDLMGLMPFAQIATRIGGALVVVVASISYPLLY